MGLTNHHVAFGKKRLKGFPIADKANTGTSYACLQPAPIDLKGRVKQLKATAIYLSRLKIRKDSQTIRNPGYCHPIAIVEADLDDDKSMKVAEAVEAINRVKKIHADIMEVPYV
jgi:hypothetical protein